MSDMSALRIRLDLQPSAASQATGGGGLTRADGVSSGRGSTGVVTESPPRGYHERYAAGWCVYGACPRRAEGWPDPTHHHCPRHKAKVQARQRLHRRVQRKQLADAGKCIRCRKPSPTYRCPGCAILDGVTLPTGSVSASVVTTHGDQWRRDNDGWARYRGKGRRGPPPVQVNDDSDIASAMAAIDRGRAALVYARSVEVAQLGRITRKDALQAALSILAHAARFLEDLVDRNGGIR